jgi:hypothetical protein
VDNGLAIIIASISAGISGVGLIVQAVGVKAIHRTSKANIEATTIQAAESAKRDATAKIAEAYTQWNLAIMTNDQSLQAAKKYIWSHISDSDYVIKRALWNTLLNTIYLEFKFSKQGLIEYDQFYGTAVYVARSIARSDCDSFIVFLDEATDYAKEFRDVFRQAALTAAHREKAHKLGFEEDSNAV